MKNLYLIPAEKLIKNTGDLVKDQHGYMHFFTKNDGKEYGKTTTILNICIANDETPKVGDWVIYTKGVLHCQRMDYEEDLANIEIYGGLKITLTTDTQLIKDGVQAIDDEFLEWFVKNPSCEEVEIGKILQVRHGVSWYDLPNQKQGNESESIYRTIHKIIIPKKITFCPICNDELMHQVNSTNLNCVRCGETIKEEPKQKTSVTDDLKDILAHVTKMNDRHKKQETLEEIAERLVKKHPDFKAEGLSEYQNGKFNGIIEGIKYQQERSYSEEEILDIAKQAYSMGRSNYTIKAFNEWFEQFKKK